MTGWEYFGKYIGIQGVLAVGVTAAVIALVFTHIEPPKEVWSLLGLAWGFFFAKNGGNYAAALKGEPH